MLIAHPSQCFVISDLLFVFFSHENWMLEFWTEKFFYRLLERPVWPPSQHHGKVEPPLEETLVTPLSLCQAKKCNSARDTIPGAFSLLWAMWPVKPMVALPPPPPQQNQKCWFSCQGRGPKQLLALFLVTKPMVALPPPWTQNQWLVSKLVEPPPPQMQQTNNIFSLWQAGNHGLFAGKMHVVCTVPAVRSCGLVNHWSLVGLFAATPLDLTDKSAVSLPDFENLMS